MVFMTTTNMNKVNKLALNKQGSELKSIKDFLSDQENKLWKTTSTKDMLF